MTTAELLRASQNDANRALLRALDLHRPGEEIHAERVAVYAVATAHALGLSEEMLLDIRRAAQLHDVGKMAIDRAVLHKLGELTENDWRELKHHASMSETILGSLPWMNQAAPMVRHHHERWDGTGYPDGLKGEEIPLGARIIAVAEAFDHITFGSSWREPQGREDARKELEQEAGRQFDPAVVAAFLRVEPLIQPLGLG